MMDFVCDAVSGFFGLLQIIGCVVLLGAGLLLPFTTGEPAFLLALVLVPIWNTAMERAMDWTGR